MGAQVAQMWLHDDTEEDLLGADWHQEAIGEVVNALRDQAEIAGLPWHVGNQLPLAAWKPDGTAWRPSPDVMVHTSGRPERREEMSAHLDGLPALVIEVVSKSTWYYDQDVTQGKSWGYLTLGIPELLLFDPSGEFLDTPCRGWRLKAGKPRVWQPDAEGRYQSALGTAFAPEGMLLRVFDRSGQPLPFRHEKIALVAGQRQELERQRQELEQQRRELERQQQAVIERDARILERDARIARLESEMAALRGQDKS